MERRIKGIQGKDEERDQNLGWQLLYFSRHHRFANGPRVAARVLPKFIHSQNSLPVVFNIITANWSLHATSLSSQSAVSSRICVKTSRRLAAVLYSSRRY